MFESFSGGSALNCLYGAALLLGFLYALFLLFVQGVGHAFDLSDVHLGDLFHVGGAHLDIGGHAGLHVGDHGDVAGDGHEATGLSLLAISGFVTAFGAFGLASGSLLSASPLLSLFLALLGGVLVGGALQLFFIHVLSPTTSHNIQLDELKGARAEVITPIPAGGMGQVACVWRGQRLTLSARSSGGVDIGRGGQVRIDSVINGVAYVSAPGESA